MFPGSRKHQRPGPSSSTAYSQGGTSPQASHQSRRRGGRIPRPRSSPSLADLRTEVALQSGLAGREPESLPISPTPSISCVSVAKTAAIFRRCPGPCRRSRPSTWPRPHPSSVPSGQRIRSCRYRPSTWPRPHTSSSFPAGGSNPAGSLSWRGLPSRSPTSLNSIQSRSPTQHFTLGLCSSTLKIESPFTDTLQKRKQIKLET